MKFKYTRKKINDKIEKLMNIIVNQDAPTAYSHLNQIKYDLLAKQEDKKECTCEEYYIPDSCPVHGLHRFTNPLIEKCPNCTEPDENIKPMPDGSCGVCGGKGYIEWKKIGKIK